MVKNKASKKPTVIFMGSKPGAVVALSILLERGWRVKYVVISRKISHPWISGPILEEYARSRGLKVITQKELPRTEMVDFVISYMFRYKVKPDVIALASRAALNFHAAPLPGYGGWAFYNLAILEGVAKYGCTCHWLDEGFDTGPIFKVRSFPIDASRETAVSLEKETQEEMIRLFIDFCKIAESGGKLPKRNQDKKRFRYLDYEHFTKLKKIPASADGETVERYARAFWYPPYECAHIVRNRVRLEVIPRIVKEETARLLHKNDYEDLQLIAKNYHTRRK